MKQSFITSRDQVWSWNQAGLYGVPKDGGLSVSHFFFFLIYLFFGWRITALQNFLVCQTSTWISHRYTYVPSLSPISCRQDFSLPLPSLSSKGWIKTVANQRRSSSQETSEARLKGPEKPIKIRRPVTWDEIKCKSLVSDSVTPWTILSMEFFRPEYWSG